MNHSCRAPPSNNPAILTVTDPRLWSKLEVKLRVGDLPFKTQRKWLQIQRIISCQGKQRTSASERLIQCKMRGEKEKREYDITCFQVQHSDTL